MKELMISLLLWIGANSSLSIEGVVLPEVEFISSEEMHEMMNIEMPKDCTDAKVKALYYIPKKIIYLQKEWDKNKVMDRSFLLHELIHHLQKNNNYECREKREEEAYELQFTYLKEHSIKNPKEALHISDLFYIVMTSCYLM
jgi:hypothetical protein